MPHGSAQYSFYYLISYLCVYVCLREHCRRDDNVVIFQIVGSNSEEQQKMFGRHFDIDDELVSHISRRSIDILKANYRVSLNLHRLRSSSSSICLLKTQQCFLTKKISVSRMICRLMSGDWL